MQEETIEFKMSGSLGNIRSELENVNEYFVEGESLLGEPRRLIHKDPRSACLLCDNCQERFSACTMVIETAGLDEEQTLALSDHVFGEIINPTGVDVIGVIDLRRKNQRGCVFITTSQEDAQKVFERVNLFSAV